MSVLIHQRPLRVNPKFFLSPQLPASGSLITAFDISNRKRQEHEILNVNPSHFSYVELPLPQQSAFLSSRSIEGDPRQIQVLVPRPERTTSTSPDQSLTDSLEAWLVATSGPAARALSVKARAAGRESRSKRLVQVSPLQHSVDDFSRFDNLTFFTCPEVTITRPRNSAANFRSTGPIMETMKRPQFHG